MTRITYKKLSDGTYTSKEMLAIDKVVRVVLDKTVPEAKILNDTGELITMFVGGGEAKLKLLVKNYLKEIGVNFQNEVRPRFSKANNE
jgi:hypothetical protein